MHSSKLPRGIPISRLALRAPRQLRAGVPINVLKSIQEYVCGGRFSMNPKTGEIRVIGSPVVIQWVIIFIKAIVSNGNRDKVRNSKVPSSISSMKKRSRVRRTANKAAIHNSAGATEPSNFRSEFKDRGNRNITITKNTRLFIIAPPFRKAAFSSQ